MRCSLRTAGPVSPGCSPRSDGRPRGAALGRGQGRRNEDARGEYRNEEEHQRLRRTVCETVGSRHGFRIRQGVSRDASAGRARRRGCARRGLSVLGSDPTGGNRACRGSPKKPVERIRTGTCRDLPNPLQARQIRCVLPPPAIRARARRGAPPAPPVAAISTSAHEIARAACDVAPEPRTSGQAHRAARARARRARRSASTP